MFSQVRLGGNHLKVILVMQSTFGEGLYMIDVPLDSRAFVEAIPH